MYEYDLQSLRPDRVPMWWRKEKVRAFTHSVREVCLLLERVGNKEDKLHLQFGLALHSLLDSWFTHKECPFFERAQFMDLFLYAKKNHSFYSGKYYSAPSPDCLEEPNIQKQKREDRNRFYALLELYSSVQNAISEILIIEHEIECDAPD